LIKKRYDIKMNYMEDERDLVNIYISNPDKEITFSF